MSEKNLYAWLGAVRLKRVTAEEKYWSRKEAKIPEGLYLEEKIQYELETIYAYQDLLDARIKEKRLIMRIQNNKLRQRSPECIRLNESLALTSPERDYLLECCTMTLESPENLSDESHFHYEELERRLEYSEYLTLEDILNIGELIAVWGPDPYGSPEIYEKLSDKIRYVLDRFS